jgi:hypothetical protein
MLRRRRGGPSEAKDERLSPAASNPTLSAT